MIATNSTTIKKNNQENLLERVEDAIKKGGRATINSRCFDIRYDFNRKDFLILQAFQRMLKYCLVCDFSLTDEYLEKMNLYLIRR